MAFPDPELEPPDTRLFGVFGVKGRFSHRLQIGVVDFPPFNFTLFDDIGPLVVDVQLTERHGPDADTGRSPGCAVDLNIFELCPPAAGMHDEVVGAKLELRGKDVDRIIDPADAHIPCRNRPCDGIKEGMQVDPNPTEAAHCQRERLARYPNAPFVLSVWLFDEPCGAERAGIAAELVALRAA